MADYLAIQGVSRTLSTLLRDRMEREVAVTLAPPDVKVTGFDKPRVNLYLVQVMENAALKNQEIPGQGHPASYGNPPLSLDLRYLMTTHSDPDTNPDADLDCQALLGDAMRVLHDHPIVTDRLEITRSAAGTLGDPILDLGLLREFEKVRICLEPEPLDEITKIWSALPAANFRRSVLYRVSVVQIESNNVRRIARPVTTRRIFATTLHRPEIVDVYRTPAPAGDVEGDVRVKLLDQITIEGRNFIAEKAWVRLGDLDPIRVTGHTALRICTAIPDDIYPTDADHPAIRPIPPELLLQPGPLKVQVVTEHAVEAIEGGLDPGESAKRPRQFRSNLGLLQLMPEISNISPAQGKSSALLSVSGKRLYGEDLRSHVLIGDALIEIRRPREPNLNFAGDPWTDPTPTKVEVPLDSLENALPKPPPAGDEYLVHVQVNGVQNKEDTFTFRLMPR